METTISTPGFSAVLAPISSNTVSKSMVLGGTTKPAVMEPMKFDLKTASSSVEEGSICDQKIVLFAPSI